MTSESLCLVTWGTVILEIAQNVTKLLLDHWKKLIFETVSSLVSQQNLTTAFILCLFMMTFKYCTKYIHGRSTINLCIIKP